MRGHESRNPLYAPDLQPRASARSLSLRRTMRSMCRKSSGKNLINLPLRSILQRTQRLVVLITVPCGGGSPQKL